MFGRIVLAVDGTESDEVATDFVTGLVRGGPAAVHIVHVNEYLVGGRGFTRETEAGAQDIVDRATRALVVAGVGADSEVRHAHPFDTASRIAEAAAAWSADVIVLGSRRQRRLGRFSGQGLRDQVTARTTLPILTVPAPLRLGRRHRLATSDLTSIVPDRAAEGETEAHAAERLS